MTRFLALCGFSGGFLALSPKLRLDVVDGLNHQLETLQRNSPYSYVALAVIGLLSMCIYIRKSATPR